MVGTEETWPNCSVLQTKVSRVPPPPHPIPPQTEGV